MREREGDHLRIHGWTQTQTTLLHFVWRERKEDDDNIQHSTVLNCDLFNNSQSVIGSVIQIKNVRFKMR